MYLYLVVCERPTPLVNGGITQDQSQYNVGEMITYSCNEMYVLVDGANVVIPDIQVMCSSNGVFEPTLPEGARCRASMKNLIVLIWFLYRNSTKINKKNEFVLHKFVFYSV